MITLSTIYIKLKEWLSRITLVSGTAATTSGTRLPATEGERDQINQPLPTVLPAVYYLPGRPAGLDDLPVPIVTDS